MKKLYAAAIGLILLTSCGHVDLSKNVFETSTGTSETAAQKAASTSVTVTAVVTTMHDTAASTAVIYNGANIGSAEMPEIALIKRVTANEYCSDKTSVSIIDRNGNRYYTEDANICAMDNAEVNEKLAAGALGAYLTKKNAADTGEIAENYKLVCEAAENDDCSFNEPEAVPDVEASVISVCGMYYNSDRELKSVRIYENKCLTDIFTNSDKLTRVYKWYNALSKTE